MTEHMQAQTADPGRRVVLAGFLVIVVAGLALIAWGWERPPERLAIHELWLRPEAHDGDRVAIEGTLRVFLPDTPRQHYAVEDERRHRVGVTGVERVVLDELVDLPVSVEGTLRVSPERGILIEVSAIGEETR